jgi:flagellar basal-body rod modification protein FlgD
MTPTTSTSQTPGTGTTDPSSGAGDNGLSGLTNEDTFLQLLVSQIENQDPLNPTDSIQFVSQLVSFSQLEQLLNINQGIQTLDNSATPPPSSSPTTPTTPTNPTQN